MNYNFYFLITVFLGLTLAGTLTWLPTQPS